MLFLSGHGLFGYSALEFSLMLGLVAWVLFMLLACFTRDGFGDAICGTLGAFALFLAWPLLAAFLLMAVVLEGPIMVMVVYFIITERRSVRKELLSAP